MFLLLPYSSFRVDSLKRSPKVLHDFATSPVTPRITTTPRMMRRGVRRKDMVVTAAPNNIKPMTVTPAREMVRISATIARGIVAAHINLRLRGRREVRAVTMNGVTVQSKPERLLDSI